MVEIEQTESGNSKSELLERLENLKFKSEALYNFVPSLHRVQGAHMTGARMIFDDLFKGIVSLIDEIES